MRAASFRHRLPWDVLSLVALLSLVAAHATFADEVSLAGNPAAEGVLTVLWGDPAPGSGEPVRTFFDLARRDGSHERLPFAPDLADDLGGTVRLNSTAVQVSVRESGSSLQITAAGAAGGFTGSGDPQTLIGGSRPWVTLPCRFPEIADEQEDLAYFTAMYGDTYPGLDHYWQALSYGLMDIDGSLAADWLDLPEERSHYVSGDPLVADLGALFADCVAAHDADVDFSRFEGIQLAFNDDLDCCAWGGGRHATLDGVQKVFRVAWLPPWAFQNVAISAHEMGHGLGLPHADNLDGDGNPYDNPWDVMSSATGFTVSDAVFGSLGKHVVTYFKYALGWLAAGEIADLNGPSMTVRLDPQRAPAVDDYRVARVRRRGDGASLYVELRQLQGYDAALPGEAVIIHEVEMGGNVPRVVDGDSPPATYSSTEGVMWRDGETFADGTGIGLSFEATAEGWLVRLDQTATGPLFSADFEVERQVFSTSGLFQVTDACAATSPGHSSASALFFGEVASCDYDSDRSSTGTATFYPVDLTGVSAPYTVAFQYLLDMDDDGGDSVEVHYFDAAANTWNLLTGNLAATAPLPATGAAWGRFAAELPLAPGTATTGLRFTVAVDDSGNAGAGFWVDDVEVSGCQAPEFLDVSLGSDDGAAVYEACDALQAGGDYSVADGGDVTFRAPSSVIFSSGFRVASGASLQVVLEAPQSE